MKPKKGTHLKFCTLCGKKIGEVIHYGGKRKLKKCKYCQNTPAVCLDCYDSK